MAWLPSPERAIRAGVAPSAADWQARLETVVDTMRQLSLQTDPQQMVRMYADRMQQLLPVDRRISLSRRGMSAPEYRITRFSGWQEEINPWREVHKLPTLSGGLLSQLVYADRPTIINDAEIDPEDPAAQYLEDQRSILAIPLFDQGASLNMVVVSRTEPNAFTMEELPERVWMANLFGRATQTLVLAEQRDAAYKEVDRELQVVADIQRSLLPAKLPAIPTLELAAHYQTSRRAGGDYYDFFPLSRGRWGILIADVSGHGTPSAVVMAVTHCIAHLHCSDNHSPRELLNFLNHHLASRYTSGSGHFVTAFYGIYDPATRGLLFSSAGHNPPRLRHCGQWEVDALDQANYLPMGFMPDLDYREAEVTLSPGDRLVLYTDGITEAANRYGDLFGVARLDMVVADCRDHADGALKKLINAVQAFTGDVPLSDDRTLIVMDVVS